MKKFATALSVACAIVACSKLGFDLGVESTKAKLGRDIDSLRYVIKDMAWELRFRHDITREFEKRIADIRNAGHHPDSSLVYKVICDLYFKYPNLRWSDYDTTLSLESGWGSDKRRGMFGETRIAQRDTASLREDLEDLGFSVIGFDPEKYSDVVSATEYMGLYILRIRCLKNQEYNHVFYYNGYRSQLKHYNTARFDSAMATRKQTGR